MHRLVALMTLLLVLWGCSEPAPAADPPVGDDPLTQDGRDLRTDLLANDTLPAPEWQVGDVFEQHMFVGSSDRQGRHIKTVVVEADREGYTVATPDEEAARLEAVYDYPILGSIGPGLETTAFGSDWSWMYAFPLTDGATWSGEMEEAINWNSYSFTDYSLTLQASYDPAIDTPHGKYPGFWIDGTTQDGDLLARYNYVPAIGWFSHFWLYDVETSDPQDFMFHAMSMGIKSNYTGAYLEAEAETALEDFFGVFPNPDEPANSEVEGDPVPKDFQVPASDAVMGIVVPIAGAGRTEVTLTMPGGNERSYSHHQANPGSDPFNVYFVDLESQEGRWQSRILATGAWTGAYVWITAVTVSTGQLEPPV